MASAATAVDEMPFSGATPAGICIVPSVATWPQSAAPSALEPMIAIW